MNTVKVSRAKLLEILKKNRDGHRELFLKAQEGYRAAVIKALDNALTDACNGVAFRTFVDLAAPEDHTGDYDTVISMLELSVDPEIVIDRGEFQQFVMDKWDWAAHAHFVNTTYSQGGTVAPSDLFGKRHR